MGSKSAGPNMGGGQGAAGGDVPAFDMPPTQQPVTTAPAQSGPYASPYYNPFMGAPPAPRPQPQGVGMGNMDPRLLAMMLGQQQSGNRPPSAGPAMMPPAPRPSNPLIALAQSQGYGSSPAPVISQPSNNPDQLSPESFLDSLYQSQLGRLPDLPGRTYWRTRMDQGTSPSRIREEFQFAPERQQVYNQRYTQTGSVPADIPPWMRPDRFVAQPPALPQSRPTTQSQANTQPSTQAQNMPYVMGLLRSLGVI